MKKVNWGEVGIWLSTGIIILVAIFLTGSIIYAFAKYGNKPIDEVPTWALWLIFGGRR